MTRDDVEIIKRFVNFCGKKLKINTMPKVTLTDHRDEIKTTAGYRRGKEIIIYVKGRHRVDICRSIGHELKHHQQLERGLFGLHDEIQDVGGRFEDEANADAGKLIKQFAYAGNMNLYESKKNMLLTEGKLEDAKKRFPGLPEDIIKYTSDNDPSEINRYLEWMLRQLRFELLSNPDLDQKMYMNRVLDQVTLFNDLQPYFNGKLVRELGATSKKLLSRPKDINSYQNLSELEEWNKKILPFKEDETKVNDRDIDVIFENDDYLVVRVLTHKAAMHYGFDKVSFGKEDGYIIFKEHAKYQYVIFLINKTTDQRILLLADKDLPIMHFYNTKAKEISRDAITALYIEDLPNILNKIELWINTENSNKPNNLEDDDQITALIKYTGDVNRNHYKQDNIDHIEEIEYNNGKTKQKYYVGPLYKIKSTLLWVAKNKINQNPSILLKMESDLLGSFKYNKLYDHIISSLGLDSLYQTDQFYETMKNYYNVLPVKLKTDKLSENNEDVKRLKEIDDDIHAHNETIKSLNKLLKKNEHETQLIRKQFNDAENKLRVLRIREKEITDDQEKIIKLSQGIGIVKQNVTSLKDELLRLMKNKQTRIKNREDIGKILDDLNNEYTDILSRMEGIYGDKINYEYSTEQIEHAKKKIFMNVLSDPIKWIKRVKTTPKKLLDLIDIDKLLDKLFTDTTLVKNAKDLTGLDLVGDVNINNETYYIFK